MGMPYHAGVLRPKIERYSGDKFRQLRQTINPYKIDYQLALELVAFLGVVGNLAAAARMFQGGANWKRSARILQEHLKEDAEPFIQANKEAMTVEDGLMMLSAMQDGGWKMGSIPAPVEFAVLDLKKRGMTHPEIADRLGLKPSTVARISTAGRRRDRSRKRDVDHCVAVGMLSF